MLVDHLHISKTFGMQTRRVVTVPFEKKTYYLPLQFTLFETLI